MTQLANLFVIGAMKSGSSTLHEYLSTHDDIFMSSEKEPGFFTPELWGDRSPSEYFELFSKVDGEKYVGESSTHYTKLPKYQGVVDRIAEYNRNARFVYIMRNPIDRMISHYFHAVRDIRLHGETLPIDKAIMEDPHYFNFSDYATQLRPYVERFGIDNIYTIVFEEFVGNRLESLNRLCKWLEIKNFPSDTPEIVVNSAPKSFKRAAGRGYLNKIRNSQAWEAIAPAIPKRIREIASGASVVTSNRRATPSDRETVRQIMQPAISDSVQHLIELTGRNYDVWNEVQ